MEKQWVDFKAVKDSLDALRILELFGITLKGKGDQLHGFCPLPGHSGKSGKPKSPSFSVNLSLRAFHCFGCGASGNMLEFVCLMQGDSPEDPAALRRAALRISEASQGSVDKRPALARPARSRVSVESKPSEASAEVVNAPLGFELTDLDRSHPYLSERGFSAAVVEAFGLGVARKGMMKDRVAIPIHDVDGTLVAYAGRIVDDARIGAECPRYLFPGDREKGGVRYVFRKSGLLYNAHRVKALGRRGVIVVESYTAVWWLHQAGFQNVVAVMGSSMSDAQARLLLEVLRPSFVVLLPDGDDAGRRMAETALPLIAPHAWVRWSALDDGVQPTDLPAPLLQERLGRLVGK